MQFTTRAYNTINLNRKKGIIRKESSEERLEDELNYYLSIPDPLKCYFPRIFNHGSSYTDNKKYFDLEFFGYDNLGTLFLDTENGNWNDIAENLESALNHFSTYKLGLPGQFSKTFRRQMFIEKTENEYKNLIENFKLFEEISQKDTISINGKKYKNFNHIWDEVSKYINDELVTLKDFSFIHGDFCFSNILCHDKTSVLRFVDPRGSFGKKGVYGDIIYDVSKLLHSIDGMYESIIYDKFVLHGISTSSNEAEIAFDYDTRDVSRLSPIRDVIFKNFNKKSVLTIMGTIFIGMCARHYDSTNRQILMYATGIESLHRALLE